MSVADRLAQEFGLTTSPPKGQMKEFAKRTREWQSKGHTVDQAATFAGKEIFQADFRCNPRAGTMEAILADIG
jgi:hypothetical protein